jgi:hypothetical protein
MQSEDNESSRKRSRHGIGIRIGGEGKEDVDEEDDGLIDDVDAVETTKEKGMNTCLISPCLSLENWSVINS